MKMSDVKQVKVDNWGIYFLQRLKHFFNRTDYCDLTLQFQDNAQLKVHRLVLSACTEYFELLERTCEMYEDCLVMPDDLQADVVVPIVNFMYTGQLEFKMELLDRLYQTSEIMNMPVLTKLLNSHRPHKHKTKPPQSYPIKRVSKPVETAKLEADKEVVKPSSSGTKRTFGKAFETTQYIFKEKKYMETPNKASLAVTKQGVLYKPPSPIPFDNSLYNKKFLSGDPRPTRYELPEELDTDNVFESSFSNISYASQPLMVHPETRKQYSKRPRQIGESSSKNFGASTVDIVECKKISKAHEDNIFEDPLSESITGETEMFQPFVKIEPVKDSSHLFDQIVEQTTETAKVTIETTKKNSSNSPNLDHAKIISEVLKKYPHLVKSNKNIKLKILNTPNKTAKKKVPQIEKPVVKTEPEPDFTYESDVLDSKQAAKLIALGAENFDGPWICLICGTPGRALQFTSYYKYRRHLVEVHNEKPVLTICEYCGQRTNKINYMLYHMYTKHDIEPPPQYHFPKCNKCDYIALTEALLIKHKKNHLEPKGYRNYVALTEVLAAKPQHKQPERKNFVCSVCSSSFKTSSQLLTHIQITGHKYKKPNLQCIYCMKTFLRESNFYAHLKIHHKAESIADGIIDDSDEEMQSNTPQIDKIGLRPIKSETPVNDYENVDVQYQIKQGPDGIHVVAKKQSESPNTKQKILNAGFSTPMEVQKSRTPTLQNEFMQDLNITMANDNHDVIMIDNTEYLLKGNKLVHRKPKQIPVPESILPDIKCNIEVPIEFDSNIQENVQDSQIVKNTNLVSQTGHPISIYVSNEEEYKALMSANHPIIFDPDDANKSLTVLTAPNAETLETTAIDLDNTQSNEMMIIQDGYPLNVSDAVATENSNIVVVYSHDVDQNKEFQLISTQGLGQQFVQSSAIITQNFETVTTSTPVMSAHVLSTQIDGNWQTATTIQQSINNQSEHHPTETVLHQVIPCENVEMATAIEQNTTITDLPHVEMVHNDNDQLNGNITNEVLLPHSETLPQIITDENISTQEMPPAENLPQMLSPENLHNEVITTDNMSQMNEENITEAIPSTENMVESVEPHMGENIPDESLISTVSEEADVSTEEIVEETSNAENHTEMLTYETNHVNNTLINEVTLHAHSQEMDEHVIMSQNDETNEEPEYVENVQENAELVENEQVIVNAPMTDEDDNDDAKEEEGEGEVVHHDVSNSAAEIEKIQTLASEWSEDSETVSQDNNIEPANKETVLNNETEMEESIENIQQEVVRHLTETQPTPVLNNEIESDTLDDNDSITNEEDKMPETQDNTEDTTKDVELPLMENPVPPTEKISSLLNDWEDNYSQDDDSSINDNASADDSTAVESVTTDPAKLEKAIEPQDKIKSLVSDWDDDEEDK